MTVRLVSFVRKRTGKMRITIGLVKSETNKPINNFA
jgi:hypothetical protein